MTKRKRNCSTRAVEQYLHPKRSPRTPGLGHLPRKARLQLQLPLSIGAEAPISRERLSLPHTHPELGCQLSSTVRRAPTGSQSTDGSLIPNPRAHP